MPRADISPGVSSSQTPKMEHPPSTEQQKAIDPSTALELPGKACQALGMLHFQDGVLAFGFLFVYLFIMEGTFCTCVVSAHVCGHLP